MKETESDGIEENKVFLRTNCSEKNADCKYSAKKYLSDFSHLVILMQVANFIWSSERRFVGLLMWFVPRMLHQCSNFQIWGGGSTNGISRGPYFNYDKGVGWLRWGFNPHPLCQFEPWVTYSSVLVQNMLCMIEKTSIAQVSLWSEQINDYLVYDGTCR